MKVDEKIDFICKSLGIKQKELATKLNMAEQSLSRARKAQGFNEKLNLKLDRLITVVDSLNASAQSSPMVVLGDRLRRAREARGMSVDELAERSKLLAEDISAVESKQHMEYPFIWVLANTLQLSPAWLNGSGTDDVPTRNPTGAFELTSDGFGIF